MLRPPARPKLSRRKTATPCDGYRGANRRYRREEPIADDDVHALPHPGGEHRERGAQAACGRLAPA
jgi:hypothetical protein